MIINTFIGYFFIGENGLKINFIYRLNRDTWDQQIIDVLGT